MFLCLDSSQTACSAAITNGKTILADQEQPQAGKQIEQLFPLVTACLEQANTSLDAIKAIIVTTGPGSFSGVRIALSAALGVAIANNTPVYGITTLAAINRAHNATLVAIDARRGQCYTQEFSNISPQSEPKLLNLNDLKTTQKSAYSHDPEGLLPSDFQRITLGANTIAQAIINHGAADLPAASTPCYIRPADAKKSTRTTL